MDLRKLQHAATLAAEGNFARAAARLHITQSALSQSIARLEAEAGFALFDRDRNGARPTSAGKSFLASAEALLLHARGLAREAELMRGCDAGSVSFGFGPVPASTLLLPALRLLARDHPGLTAHARVADSEALLVDLIEERIEFFVASATALQHEPRIVIRPLASFDIGFFVRAEHPLARKRNIAMQDLLAYPLLSVHIAETDRPLAKRNLGLPSGADWPPTLFCDDIHALRQLALDSDGVLFAPDAAVTTDRRAGLLVKLDPRDRRQGSAAKTSVITLANRSLSPAAAMMIERLRELAAEGAAPGNRR